jgi:hypothetical protein
MDGDDHGESRPGPTSPRAARENWPDRHTEPISRNFEKHTPAAHSSIAPLTVTPNGPRRSALPVQSAMPRRPSKKKFSARFPSDPAQFSDGTGPP